MIKADARHPAAKKRRALVISAGILVLIVVGVWWWAAADASPEAVAASSSGGAESPNTCDHGHDDDDVVDEPPAVEEDPSDVGPPDWVAELEDTKTGDVREVRAVLRRAGLSYFSPGNFRASIVHTLGDWQPPAGQRANETAAPAVLVLLYRPGSDLCDAAQPKFAALAETVDRALNESSWPASLSRPPLEMAAFTAAVFRVDAYASQDEIDAGGAGSGGDGADVIREGRAEDLLSDVPAVVYFVPDATAPTGIRMHRWNGTLDAKTVLLRLASFGRRFGFASDEAASTAIDQLLTAADVDRTSVGTFTDGALDV